MKYYLNFNLSRSYFGEALQCATEIQEDLARERRISERITLQVPAFGALEPPLHVTVDSCSALGAQDRHHGSALHNATVAWNRAPDA